MGDPAGVMARTVPSRIKVMSRHTHSTSSRTVLLLLQGCVLWIALDGGSPALLGEEDPGERGIPVHELSVKAWAKLRQSYGVESIDRLAQLGNENIDIAVAALLIAKEFDSRVDVKKNLRMVDRIAFELLHGMPGRIDPHEAMGLLSETLFDRFGVIENHGGFDPTEGFLSALLSSKQGNCLGLTTLYLAVGRRLGFPLHMVRVPDHVFVRYACNGKEINIETTDQGRVQGDAYYMEKYHTERSPMYLCSLTVKEELAELLRNCGLAWKGRKAYEKAFTAYTLAIELNARDAPAYTNRGYVRHLEGRYDEAIADFNRAIGLDPDCVPAYHNRGYAWRMKGNYDRAISDYSRVIKLRPDNGQAYLNRGYAWYKKGKFRKAVADYTRAIEIDPDDEAAYNNRGFAWKELGEHKKAGADHARASTLDPAYKGIRRGIERPRHRDGKSP
jgi:regulator of sirC expression with transglutaminase-like and TPR domain